MKLLPKEDPIGLMDEESQREFEGNIMIISKATDREDFDMRDYIYRLIQHMRHA